MVKKNKKINKKYKKQLWKTYQLTKLAISKSNNKYDRELDMLKKLNINLEIVFIYTKNENKRSYLKSEKEKLKSERWK